MTAASAASAAEDRIRLLEQILDVTLQGYVETGHIDPEEFPDLKEEGRLYLERNRAALVGAGVGFAGLLVRSSLRALGDEDTTLDLVSEAFADSLSQLPASDLLSELEVEAAQAERLRGLVLEKRAAVEELQAQANEILARALRAAITAAILAI